MSSAIHITNLLYLYAERMDAGDLEGAAELFRHARIKIGDDNFIEGSAPLLELWRRHVKIFPCGTPRTKRLVTNPIVEIDEEAGEAISRSYFTGQQATSELPLQVTSAGRYHDKFKRIDGEWQFVERDYSLLDLIGNQSQHLNTPAQELLAKAKNRGTFGT